MSDRVEEIEAIRVNVHLRRTSTPHSMETLSDYVSYVKDRAVVKTYQDWFVKSGLASANPFTLRYDLGCIESWVISVVSEASSLDSRGQLEYLADQASKTGFSENDTGVVYGIFNESDPSDRRVYIGESRGDILTRMRSHPGSCKLLEEAFCGSKENWKIVVLVTIPQDALMDTVLYYFEELVQRLLHTVRSVDNPNGLNAHFGNAFSYTNASDESWLGKLVDVVKFITENDGKYPSQTSVVAYEKRLAHFVQNQRRTQNSMPSYRRNVFDILEKDNVWAWRELSKRTSIDDCISCLINDTDVSNSGGYLFPQNSRYVISILKAYKKDRLSKKQLEKIDDFLPGIKLGIYKARLRFTALKYKKQFDTNIPCSTKANPEERKMYFWRSHIIDGTIQLESEDEAFFRDIGLSFLLVQRIPKNEREQRVRKMRDASAITSMNTSSQNKKLKSDELEERCKASANLLPVLMK